MLHPIDELGDKRICPITGKLFYLAWSDKACYDSCDSCKPNQPTLSERLAKLERERNEGHVATTSL